MLKVFKRLFVPLGMMWFAALILYDYSHYLMWTLVHKLNLPSDSSEFWFVVILSALVLVLAFVFYPIRQVVMRSKEGFNINFFGPFEARVATGVAIFATWILYTFNFWIFWFSSENNGNYGLPVFLNISTLIIPLLVGIFFGVPILNSLKKRRTFTPLSIIVVGGLFPLLILIVLDLIFYSGDGGFWFSDSVGDLIIDGVTTPLGWLKDIVQKTGASIYGAIAGVFCIGFLAAENAKTANTKQKT